jgi:hypothetical protein
MPSLFDEQQLTLTLLSREEQAAGLLVRLRAHGLSSLERCTLTRNRVTMVSMTEGHLRLHESLAAAPDVVLGAIVDFFTLRRRDRRDRRNEARRIILAHSRVPAQPARRRRPLSHPADAGLAGQLAQGHAILNARHFDGRLTALCPLVSRRMRSRLGHYSPRSRTGDTQGSGQIAISRRHIHRDGMRAAMDTLLHEMVHQWQDESGLAVDHGVHFRRRAREVGTAPSARRQPAISY